MSQIYTEGKFIHEFKHRFKCMVNIEGIDEICYVASSSHLAPFIKLINKKVLLRENKSKSGKTKHTLFAVNYKNTYILLDLGFINKLVANYISEKCLFDILPESIKREQMFTNGYKADVVVYNKEKMYIIEAKALLTYDKIATFPTSSVSRAIIQLSKIKELLEQGYLVYYWLVLLNPKSETIVIDTCNSDFYNLYKNCVSLGMKTIVARIRWTQKKGFSIKNIEIANVIREEHITYVN